jgi:hypothetical protein
MPPVKKPAAKKRPPAAGRKRRAAQATAEAPPTPVVPEAAPPAPEANPAPKPARLALVIGEGDDMEIQPVSGVMLMLDEEGSNLQVLPIGIHELMVGDVIRNGLKLHDAKFD